MILTLFASFSSPMDCYLQVSLLISAERSANVNIYFGHAQVSHMCSIILVPLVCLYSQIQALPVSRVSRVMSQHF